MVKSRRLFQLALVAVLLLFAALPNSAGAVDLWFAPPDDIPRGPVIMNQDFYRLFDPGTEWARAASQISTFALNSKYAEEGPEDRLKRISQWLQDHHIALDVNLQAVYAQGCGQGIEGMVQVEHQPGDIARRLKRLGIPVAFFSFDGPLGFGHIYQGGPACKYSVREVAHRLAHTVADVRSSYPDAKFVDSEGPTDQPLDVWKDTLSEWLDDYREETGTDLDALAMDANWHKWWKDAAGPTIAILHAHHAKAGIFITATGGKDVTDASWLAEAKQHVTEIGQLGADLDFAVVSSWMLHPWRMLPEDDPLTLTSLIDYIRPPSGEVRDRLSPQSIQH